ncbi:MAG: ATP-binding protein [Ilumatobacteraceae bacterium]
MPNLRDRVADRDRDRFVGREDELAYFDSVLAGDLAHRVVHVCGPGGIGKSALLRDVVRRGAGRGYDTFWIDGRDMPPFPAQIDAIMSRITDAAPALVVFDSYELISSLDSHLRDRVIPDLPDTTLVIIGSRQHPSRAWFEHGWDAVVHAIDLGGLDPDESRRLLIAHGIDAASDTVDLIRRSRGSPLALVVGADAEPGNVAIELAERLLGDEVDLSRHRVLAVAAIARVTTPELLADALDDDDPHESFKWLATRSFSEPLTAGITLHALVADAVATRIRSVDPSGEAVLRRSIADHLHRRALAGHVGLSTDLQHLVRDPDVKWGFSSDVGTRYRIDRVRADDADRVGDVLESVGLHDWWAATRVFFDDHPEYCGVARDADGRIGGYFVAVSPDRAPAVAETDPLLGPWLQYARHELRTASAVLWREAVDLTGGMGEVTSLLGAGGLMSTGVANPRYGFLPISPLVPAARQFSEALDATHLSELDLSWLGQDVECHLVDFGPSGLIGFQRDWIYRETGAPPPTDVPAIDAGALLRLLRDPDSLARGPMWLGAAPADRLTRLRRLVEQSLVVFGGHRDDLLARAIVEAAYLGENAPHETIARQLHLSRSAYFRRLHAAAERVGEQLVANLHERR